MPGRVLRFAAVLLGFVAALHGSEAPVANVGWPARVLITNDDGIEDEDRLVALARAFRDVGAEVVVAVPREDRSGTTHLMTLVVRQPTVAVERLARHEAGNDGPAAAFYVVDGYPADCVVFALAGPMSDEPPDLVVSGINGGANLAEAWLGSGTIGAARIAAYVGIPALAVSGIDEDDPRAAAPLAAWVARLARTETVRDLPAGAYLTIAVPPRPLEELAGVKVARRSGLRLRPLLTRRDNEEAEDGVEIWEITGAVAGEIEPGTDAALYDEGWIVITPMRADEHDPDLLEVLRRQSEVLPEPSR